MKVVDLVARIPKHLDLHFSDFSMNLYRIYKFAGLENKKEKEFLFAQRPLEEAFFSRIGPWPGKQGRGGLVRPAPASYAGRRRGGWGGEAREDRVLPIGVSDWVRGGLRRRV